MSTDDIRVIHGDCLDVLRGMPDASVDAVVTDPPAGISFMDQAWDHHRGGRAAWVEWLAARLAECHRVARPGSRLLCWALPRTSHWTGCAVEDAGWVIEDRVSHLFGTGFPKHKSKLKPACEDWWLAIKPAAKAVPLNIDQCRIEGAPRTTHADGSYKTCEEGYGGGWKARTLEVPAGRWPANVVLSHSPGCQLVGAKRVKGSHDRQPADPAGEPRANREQWRFAARTTNHTDADGLETVEEWACEPGCAVAELDRQSGVRKSGLIEPHHLRHRDSTLHAYGEYRTQSQVSYGDSGGASRFFYVSKASRADRGPDNNHPTVKSADLMEWLCRLVTPRGGIILDPFAGSGSTLRAARNVGCKAVGVEIEPRSIPTIERRLKDAELPLFDRPGVLS